MKYVERFAQLSFHDFAILGYFPLHFSPKLSTISTYEKKIAEYTKGIRELYLDKVKGILSEQDYLDLSKDFVTQKERLEKLVADTQKQLDTLERKMEDGDNRRQLIEQYTNLEHLDREIEIGRAHV